MGKLAVKFMGICQPETHRSDESRACGDPSQSLKNLVVAPVADSPASPSSIASMRKKCSVRFRDRPSHSRRWQSQSAQEAICVVSLSLLGGGFGVLMYAN